MSFSGRQLLMDESAANVHRRLNLLTEEWAQSKGDLKIANVNRLIRNLLEITNLVKKIELFDSVEDAVASFTKKR